VASDILERGAQPPTVALLPWGDVFEDFLDRLGVSYDELRREFVGSWMFGYAAALATAAVRTVIVCPTSRFDQHVTATHEPTGAELRFLPTSALPIAARAQARRADHADPHRETPRAARHRCPPTARNTPGGTATPRRRNSAAHRSPPCSDPPRESPDRRNRWESSHAVRIRRRNTLPVADQLPPTAATGSRRNWRAPAGSVAGTAHLQRQRRALPGSHSATAGAGWNASRATDPGPGPRTTSAWGGASCRTGCLRPSPRRRNRSGVIWVATLRLFSHRREHRSG